MRTIINIIFAGGFPDSRKISARSLRGELAWSGGHAYCQLKVVSDQKKEEESKPVATADKEPAVVTTEDVMEGLGRDVSTPGDGILTSTLTDRDTATD